MTTHDDTLEPTLQDWGFPEKAGTDERACWYRQERFLDAFRQCGKIGTAAKAVGITRFAVQRWQRTDVYSFRKRLEMAHQDYAESLETDFDNWVQESKHNTQIARIFRLKAVWPEKYREEVKVLNADAPLRMLEMLKELGKRELEQTVEGEYKELPPPAAEGEYREVSRGRPGTPPPPVDQTPPQSAGMSPPRTEAPPGSPPPWSAKERRQQQVRAARDARAAQRPTQDRHVNRR
jgi:hypothetical protein